MTLSTLSGEMFIGFDRVQGSGDTFRAVNPATNEELEPEFALGGDAEVEEAVRLATEAFDTFRETTPEDRAAFLEAIADNIEALGDELISRGAAESGLAEARLTNERGRTTTQLRLFAEVLREGSYSGVRIDPALPGRTPPRPDIRLRKIALGPVAVFGSSNFPLAFSNAGGDTASALAAGCPVVVKVHNAHPGTALLVSSAVTKAVRDAGLPAGVYSSLLGSGRSVGTALVAHPGIKAVGFTGSRSGGLALVAVAAKRPEPIPVYAEMSSTNPVFVLESSLPGQVAEGFFGSLTLGSGQFCTNPGLIFVPEGAAGDQFVATLVGLVSSSVGQTMLTAGICQSYVDGASRLAAIDGVTSIAEGSSGPGENAPAAQVFSVSADRFAEERALQDEIFGAASLIVRYSDLDHLINAAEGLEGQLTAAIHCADTDVDAAHKLLVILERKVGRILFNGWPTGVEVTHAMVHGGPSPATSDSRSTSVGTLAIERFQRPVSYQNVPSAILPVELQDSNPWNQVRRIDGRIEGL